MSNTTITPNMSLPNPNPGIDPGPDYANNIYASFVLVDQHNHSPGYGVLIQPNGLNITSDLSFTGTGANPNNATQLRSVRFTEQTTAFTSAADIGCLYELNVGGNGELFYIDSSQNQVQLTANGTVNATTTALVNGNNRASFVANQLVVYSNSTNNTPGNIVAGSILLGNNTPSSQYLTLQPPNAMGSSFSLTLPSVPGSTQLLQIDSSGNITASGVAPATVSPTGSIIMYGGAAAPTGYLLCDGTSYLRTAQPTLFAAIGTAYGAVDATHFNVPDLRGIFPRGVSGTSGNDPDASSRTTANPGGNTGNNVGSFQADALGTHTHNRNPSNISETAIGGFGGAPASTFGGGSTQAANFSNTGDLFSGNSSTETRPKNVYVNFIIKT